MTNMEPLLFDDLQNRLRFDEDECPIRPKMRGIADAIAGNPECRAGVMARYGWAFSPEGPTSDEGRPELLVMVTRGDFDSHFPDYWYGHVFYLVPGGRDGFWVSKLVRAGIGVDGTSPDSVLTRWREHVVLLHVDLEFNPGYIWREYFDEDGVTCTGHDSLEEAVIGLVEKVRRFNRLPGSEFL